MTAAEAIFLTEGYEGATIRRIAQAAGLSSTALYMHFSDKGELLLEIAKRAIFKLISQHELLGQQELDAAPRVRAMLSAYMNFALDHPHSYQLVFGQPLPLAEERLVDVRALGGRCFELFERAVKDLAENGGLRGEPVVAAQVAWGAAHGVVSLQINHPTFGWAASPPELAQAMLDYLFHGLLTAHHPVRSAS